MVVVPRGHPKSIIPEKELGSASLLESNPTLWPPLALLVCVCVWHRVASQASRNQEKKRVGLAGGTRRPHPGRSLIQIRSSSLACHELKDWAKRTPDSPVAMLMNILKQQRGIYF